METTGYAITSRGTASRSGRIVRTAEERAAQAIADSANATLRTDGTQVNRSNTGKYCNLVKVDFQRHRTRP